MPNQRSIYNNAKALAVLNAQKGIANGIASLDAGGKIPSDQLTLDALQYKGTWNATTNSPTLADGSGNTGDLYRVNVGGTQDLGSGSIVFLAGDYVVYNGATWEKWDNTPAVTSVNGETGAVVLDTGDIAENGNLYFTNGRAVTALTGQNISIFANDAGYITTVAGGDHGTLSGLSDDDHTQYVLLAGRAGGQTIIGGTEAGNDLVLQTTSHATRGSVFVDGLDISPLSNDLASIGTASLRYSDAYFATGAVLSLGSTGTVTLTHSANNLSITTSGANMNVDIGNAGNAAPSIRYFVGTGSGDNGSFAWMNDSDDTYRWGLIGYGVNHATLPNAVVLYEFNNAAGSAVNLYRMIMTDAGNVTFGGTTVAATVAKLNVLSTTEQQRWQYDTSNYANITVSSNGTTTFNAVGSGSSFQFSDLIKVNTALGGTGFAWGDSGSSNAYRAAFNLASTTADLSIFTASGTAGSETFAERMRIINASGILTIGGTVAYGREGQKLEVNVSANDGGAALNTWAASNEGGILDFNKSRSATIGTHTIVQDGDALGGIYFRGSSGSAFVSAAAIVAYVGGTPGASNDMPGDLAFYTTANGSGSLTERMRIGEDGFIGIGITGTAPLHIFRSSGETFKLTNTAGAGFYCETRSSASSSDIGFATLGTGKLILRAGGDTFQITSANAYFPTIGTTASAANAFLNSGSTPANEILRSTSSRVYKRDIEDMDHAYADNILKLRPVWYRSKCANDPEDFSYWGLIAEEVAEIDPRLVQWGYHNDDWNEEVVDEDGKVIKPRTLKKGAVKKPDGVTYDRLSVLLVDVVKRQQEEINAIKELLKNV